MSGYKAASFWRMIRNSAAVLLVTASAVPAAFAQTESGDSSQKFSSSTSYVAAPDPAFPSAAAAQSGGSYGGGSGSHGMWNWSHLTFEAGAGANAPIGNDTGVITWGGNFTVGAGLRVNPHLSGLIEYQFLDNKLPGALISDAGAQGGYAHIWSFTLAPVIDLFPARKNDIYFTGGGGFYRKVTSFTDPEEVEDCYYFCTIGEENVVISHFSSNQGGANLGLGFTHRLGSRDMGDSKMKLFAEARYLWIDTPRVGQTNGLGTTGLVPVTLGVRF